MVAFQSIIADIDENRAPFILAMRVSLPID